MWSLNAIFPIGFYIIIAVVSATTDTCHPKACSKNVNNEKAICGSDGLTYPNRCHFEKARCHNSSMTVVRRGPCKQLRSCMSWESSSSNSTFKPVCRGDGSYDATQCHPSTGFCWCVTPEGIPLPYTSVRRKPGAKPRCGRRKKNIRRWSPASKSRTRPCKHHDKAIFNSNLIKIFHSERTRELGSIIPMNNETDKLVITWKFRTLDDNHDNVLDKHEYRDLRKIVKKAVKPKRCAKNFARACDINLDQRISIQEWDECLTRDGMDERHGQSSSSETRSDNNDDSDDYIIDESPYPRSPPHGVLSPGTSISTNYDEDSPEAPEEDPPDCISDRQAALSDGYNQLYVPECTSDGRYQKIQCYKSAGYCWCVNEDNGKNIPGTSVKNGTPKCDQLKTSNRIMKGCPDEKKVVFLKELLQLLHSKMSENLNNSTKFNGLEWIASKEEQAAQWSFVVFDKNTSKMLERNEWKAFKDMVSNIKSLRKCGKKLPRYCDSNKDRQISMTEWLECLNVQQGGSSLGSTRTKTNTLSMLMED